MVADSKNPKELNSDLRPPRQVMRLERMGASHQTRLSFMRRLIRRMANERWSFECLRFDVDADGYGTAVYAAHAPEHTYSLVAFTQELAPEKRTDRVIAENWDATFNLFDGVPTDDDIARLAENTPKQEAGRFLSSELCLARGNKSLRLFEHMVSALASGRQPDIDRLCDVGYLMRTTAVYGSGKFGCADYQKIAGRPEMAAPFQAEMLTVFLIRGLLFDLVNHVASARGGSKAVTLRRDFARYLGIGNSTGLGMAPFLIYHPHLINNWVWARETALARVRAVTSVSSEEAADFGKLIGKARHFVNEWNVKDNAQTERIKILRDELANLAEWCQTGLSCSAPWDAVVRYAEATYSLEGQELTNSLLLEAYGDLVDDLGDSMGTNMVPKLDPLMSVKGVRDLINANYKWVQETDFSKHSSQQRFWYYSEDKLEPRLGSRYTEPGAELEMPIAIARDVNLLRDCLTERDDDETMAEFLMLKPEFRQIVRRIQSVANSPYGEIQDNLLDATVRPLDILRFKLAFFGVSKFDPKSDLWTRVNMYQGAPLLDEISQEKANGWIFPLKPGSDNPECPL